MEYNDYELVALAKEGNEDAVNLIYQKYKPIIVKKSENMIVRANHHGIEISDIMQEALSFSEKLTIASSKPIKPSCIISLISIP